jgi:hypothetical protein
MVPSSVVHTGVKSFGCEKRTPQELPELDRAVGGLRLEIRHVVADDQSLHGHE